MELSRMIDHTNLKASSTKEQIIKLINEAKDYHFASVCVNPTWVELASQELTGTDVKVCTVIGFPLGANTKQTKTAGGQSPHGRLRSERTKSVAPQ